MRLLHYSARACSAALAALALAALAAGCATTGPKPIAKLELAAAQSFPYFPVYWVGKSFEGFPLVAADGLEGYNPSIGTGVYYGDCAKNKGIFGGGGCLLPLQVKTVIYQRHSNRPLGGQRNIVVRGVPAVVYEGGRAIELYSGHVAIDIFSEDYAHALRAAQELYPANAPGSPSEQLPPPSFCPGLYGPQPAQVRRAMEALPEHICRRSAEQIEYLEEVRTNGRR